MQVNILCFYVSFLIFFIKQVWNRKGVPDFQMSFPLYEYRNLWWRSWGENVYLEVKSWPLAHKWNLDTNISPTIWLQNLIIVKMRRWRDFSWLNFQSQSLQKACFEKLGHINFFDSFLFSRLEKYNRVEYFINLAQNSDWNFRFQSPRTAHNVYLILFLPQKLWLFR